MSAPANIMQSAFEGVMGDIPSVWTANNSIRDHGTVRQRSCGSSAGRVSCRWILCETRLDLSTKAFPGKTKLGISRKHWEDSKHRDRFGACRVRNRYGCRCRNLSIPRRREHAVARRAKKFESSSSVRGWGTESGRWKNVWRIIRGGCTAGIRQDASVIPDETVKNRKIRTRAALAHPSYLASDTAVFNISPRVLTVYRGTVI